MKRVITLLAILALAAPAAAFAAEAITTDRIEFSIEENGSWLLTDFEAGVSWRGEWVGTDLMKVSGTDGSCYLLTEREGDMVELSCADLTPN